MHLSRLRSKNKAIEYIYETREHEETQNVLIQNQALTACDQCYALNKDTTDINYQDKIFLYMRLTHCVSCRCVNCVNVGPFINKTMVIILPDVKRCA